MKYKLVNNYASQHSSTDEHSLKDELNLPSKSRKYTPKNCFRLKRKIVIIIIITLLFFLASIATVAYFVWGRTSEDDTSTTLESTSVGKRHVRHCKDLLCSLKTSSLLRHSNLSLDPCQDFYEFACGNFSIDTSLVMSNHSDWTPLSRVGKWAAIQMRRMLEDATGVRNINSDGITKASEYYKACVKNFDLTSSLATDVRSNFVKFIQKIASWWPLKSDPTLHTAEKNPFMKLEEIIPVLGIHGIGLFVKIDVKYDRTLERRVVFLDVGDLTETGSRKELKEKYEIHKLKFIKHLTEMAAVLNNNQSSSEWAEAIWNLEKSLFKISYNFSHSMPYLNNSGLLTIAEIQNILGDSLNVSELLANTFKKNFSNNDQIFLQNVNYLKRLPGVLSQHLERDKANFAIWLLLHEISQFLPAEFSDYMSFLATDRNQVASQCLISTMKMFKYATGSLYSINRKLQEDDISMVQSIFTGLKGALTKLIDSRMWLVESKLNKKIKQKLRTLKLKIALKKDDVMLPVLDVYYQNFYSTMSSLENFLMDSNIVRRYDLQTLGKKTPIYNWIVNPVETLVKYDPEANEIVVPLGLLQSPIFQAVYPMPVLYGTLGSILSRQLAHFLDDCNLADHEGRSNCYSSLYHLPGAFNMRHLNEEIVKSEIEADHLGVKLAYLAYKDWQKLNFMNETSLPVVNLTTDQLFFLSYAQTWCRTNQPDDWMSLKPNYDFHQPSKQRINSVLQNTPEFSENFRCPSTSPMNPSEKCLSW